MERLAGGAISHEHEVFGGVLRGDEFEDFGGETPGLQEERAKGIGDELCLALLKNAVAQGGGEHRRGGELGAEFLLATRRNEEEAGSGRDTGGQGIVGGGVAGVQCDQDIQVADAGSGGGDLAGGEGQIGQRVRPGFPVARLHERGTAFDSGDVGPITEQVRRGEGEVAFATAHVGDAEAR